MPRDLTDLMERATSFAPPEPHAAHDITRRAAQRQRRRTTSLTAGVAAALVIAGTAGYGVTHGHDTTPEPAAPYKYGQQVDISHAVPASTLPGYSLEPWKIPSLATFPSAAGPQTSPSYRDVDAQGRLLVVDHPSTSLREPPRARLYDRPGVRPLVLPQPRTPGHHPKRGTGWLPFFLGDGRLVWESAGVQGFHVTDLAGGHDVFEDASFVRDHGRDHFSGDTDGGTNAWGDRYWFKVYDHNLPDVEGAAYDLYSATFGGRPTRVARNVAEVAVGAGRVAWVTVGGTVVTESAAGGPTRTVHVPLDAGCRIPFLELQSFGQMFAVGRDVISLVEGCGTRRSETHAVVAFDLTGRRYARIAGPFPNELSIVGDSLLLADAHAAAYRYDFVTGTLAMLGPGPKQGSPHPAPRGAGHYVLWYDAKGGHVARIPQ